MLSLSMNILSNIRSIDRLSRLNDDKHQKNHGMGEQILKKMEEIGEAIEEVSNHGILDR